MPQLIRKVVASVTSDTVTAIATSVLAVATVFAVVFAWRQTLDAAQARTAQDYLELRRIFLSVDAALDSLDRTKTYSESGGCPQWHALKRYWYFSETEWEVAQIDPAQRKNWDNTQLPQVANTLRRPPYRKSFLDMKDAPAGRWNNPTGEAFFKAVSEKYEEIRRGNPRVKALRDTTDFHEATSCAGAPGTPVE